RKMLVRHDSHQDVDIYDIYACPSGTKITVPDNTALTIGDLHGNALKLLWFCLASGIATWKDGVKGPETYALLVAAYCHYQDKFEEFCKLINNNIQFDTGFFNTKKLRLIGDE